MLFKTYHMPWGWGPSWPPSCLFRWSVGEKINAFTFIALAYLTRGEYPTSQAYASSVRKTTFVGSRAVTIHYVFWSCQVVSLKEGQLTRIFLLFCHPVYIIILFASSYCLGTTLELVANMWILQSFFICVVDSWARFKTNNNIPIKLFQL